MEPTPDQDPRHPGHALEDVSPAMEEEEYDCEEEGDEEEEEVGTQERVHSKDPRRHHHHHHSPHHSHHRGHHPRRPHSAQEEEPQEETPQTQEEEQEENQEEREPHPIGYAQEERDDQEEEGAEPEEGEESEPESSPIYPVPSPRPHQFRGHTPLLGRSARPEDANSTLEDDDEEDEPNHPQDTTGEPPQRDSLQEDSLHRDRNPKENGQAYHHLNAQEEGTQEEGEEGEEAGSTAHTLEMGDHPASCGSSTPRKQSVDSLATTATVYRAVDRAPARATLARSLSLLYALLLAALGIVFPLAFFLSGRTREAGFCFALLHIYVTLTSIIFIIYLNIAIWRQKRRERALAGDTATEQEELGRGEDQEGEEEGESGKERPANNTEENGFLAGSTDGPPSPAPRKKPPTEESTTPGGSPPPPPTNPPPSDHGGRNRTLEGCYGIRMQRVGETEDGVNWFLRLGLIAFGMGSMVLDGFRLVQFAEADVSFQCIGLLFVIFTSLRLLFTFAQTFFLFKNHRVMIHFSPLTCRFALLHLAATNLVTWVMTVVMEGANTYVHLQYDVTMAAAADTQLNTTTAEVVGVTEGTNATAAPGASALDWLFEEMPPLDCYQKQSLATEASPFLFPCVVEYSLLAVAVLCRMYVNVNRPIPTRDDVISNDVTKDTEGKSRGTLECHKANSGLFIGLFVFTLVSIGMLFFLLFEPTGNPITETTTALVYYGSDIAVNIFSLIALTPAFAQMRKLHFSVIVREVFNENLMYVSVVGFYAFTGLMVIPALMSICAGGIVALLSELQAISCMLSLIQASVQVVFIFDGLRRRAATRTHFRCKPGRSLITFLLLTNVSMWVIDTFELKEAMTAELFTDYYGNLPWILIVHVALPLTIFFRFHSTVCLSDMWVNAYRRPRMVVLPSRPMSADRVGLI